MVLLYVIIAIKFNRSPTEKQRSIDFYFRIKALMKNYEQTLKYYRINVHSKKIHGKFNNGRVNYVLLETFGDICKTVLNEIVNFYLFFSNRASDH